MHSTYTFLYLHLFNTSLPLIHLFNTSTLDITDDICSVDLSSLDEVSIEMWIFWRGSNNGLQPESVLSLVRKMSNLRLLYSGKINRSSSWVMPTITFGSLLATATLQILVIVRSHYSTHTSAHSFNN